MTTTLGLDGYRLDATKQRLGAQLKTLILLRQASAYGSAYEYTSVNDADYYAYSRAGDGTHKGLVLILNDGSGSRTKGITSPFK